MLLEINLVPRPRPGPGYEANYRCACGRNELTLILLAAGSCLEMKLDFL